MTRTTGEITTPTTTQRTTVSTTDHQAENSDPSQKPEIIEKFDLLLDPNKTEEREKQTKASIDTYQEKFGSLNMEKSYQNLS